MHNYLRAALDGPRLTVRAIGLGGVEDPSGNGWWIATHIEDVPAEEIARRAQALHGQH